MPIDDHRRENLHNWNDRVPIHTGPEGYEIDRLVNEADYLTEVVEFDRKYLGDVSGQSLLHLQCHIGTDTLSWAKLGANVTGVDFSHPALEVCRTLATGLGVEARFIESELYDAPQAIDQQFDIVYTGIGAITWLPDIDGWAQVVASFLKPGGRFYIRDGHPMYYTLDQERADDLLVVGYPYFETEAPISWDEENTYLGVGSLGHTRTNEWNHGLGETITALINAGLRIDSVEEHRFLDWQGLKHMARTDSDFVLPAHQRDLVPLEFSILATKS